MCDVRTMKTAKECLKIVLFLFILLPIMGWGIFIILQYSRAPDDVEKHIEKLIQKLITPSVVERGMVKHVLKTQYPTTAVPVLIMMLKDKKWYVRKIAAQTLGYIGPQASPAVPALLKALKDKKWYVRRSAAKALGNIGPEASAAVPELMKALKDEKWAVRESVAKTLGQMGSKAKIAIPALIGALEYWHGDVREKIVKSLGKIEDKTAVPALIKSLQDQNWHVRYQAIKSLQNMGAKALASVPALKKALLGEERIGWERIEENIQEALGKILIKSDKSEYKVWFKKKNMYTEKYLLRRTDIVTPKKVENIFKRFVYLGKHTYKCGGKNYNVGEYRHKQSGIEFVHIPGGTFMMGSNNGQDDETPIHEIKLDSFMMSKYEVTQGVWKQIMKSSPWLGKPYVKEGNNYPAVYVSWYDACAFCVKIGLQLPTEAQWEYACRATTGTKYYWGNEMNNAYSWYDKNTWDIGEKYAHKIKLKKPNAFGLHDMSGNVWEWCWDGYANYGKFERNNPSGPLNSPYHIYRGGNWSYLATYCRSANRDYFFPEYCSSILGFRVCIGPLK